MLLFTLFLFGNHRVGAGKYFNYKKGRCRTSLFHLSSGVSAAGTYRVFGGAAAGISPISNPQ